MIVREDEPRSPSGPLAGASRQPWVRGLVGHEGKSSRAGRIRSAGRRRPLGRRSVRR
jgi:hypothetical protein